MTSERVPYSKAGRMMAVSTPLGADVLLLSHLEIDERINALFEIQAAVKAQRDDLRPGDLVGATVDFRLRLIDGAQRWWNGFVTAMHEGGLTTRGTRSYAMTVRPRLWLLSQRSDCRIFQGLTTMQVIETFMSEHGIGDYILRVVGVIAPVDYSVQWNETDLDYMLRRMQQDGLYYYFAFEKGKHTFIVADHPWGYDRAPEEEVRYAEGSASMDHITEWRRTFAFTPGRRASRDWNFETMATPTGGETSFAQVPGNADYELYEFPGRFTDSRTAEAATKARIQATETGFETVEAASTVRTLGAGLTFTPVDVAKPGNIFAKQVVTAMRHVATDPTYETGGGVPSYDNTFTVMPADKPATPHRVQRRPRINGSQIALIAGPEGEEIYTDPYGRVKVWFPWDRRAKKDGTDTCWIRVGQPWAGGTWGHQVIPRIKMEALVSYQEGDPDRPFITALVPDPTNPTPYPLPDNKTRMTFRSNSYKSKGFNEMTFEDKTGAENMFFHAQKDHTTKIENNQTNSVGADQSQVVGQNQSMTVGQNMTFEAGKSINMAIGGTGTGVAALMTPFTGTGMAGLTSTMLGQALAASAGGPAEGIGGQGDEGGDVQALSQMAGALAGSAGGMLKGLAGSLIGLLNQSGTDAQRNVWNGPSPRPDAGTALAAAGSLFGQATGALFNLPGMHNHITGTMKTDHVGCARVEQVGTSKVTHVGSTFGTKVGKTWSLVAGQDAQMASGRDWTVTATRDASITAGRGITAHSGKAMGLISDGLTYVAAKDSLTLSAQTIDLHATDSITMVVGENTITIDKNGNIAIDATKSIQITAGEQVVLSGGSASFSVGPDEVKSTPDVTSGAAKANTDVAKSANIAVKNLIKARFKWAPAFVSDFAGAATEKAMSIPWVARQEGKVEHYLSPEEVAKRRADPAYQATTDGFNWESSGLPTWMNPGTWRW